jgi:hypothetical protein
MLNFMLDAAASSSPSAAKDNVQFNTQSTQPAQLQHNCKKVTNQQLPYKAPTLYAAALLLALACKGAQSPLPCCHVEAWRGAKHVAVDAELHVGCSSVILTNRSQGQCTMYKHSTQPAHNQHSCKNITN